MPTLLAVAARDVRKGDEVERLGEMWVVVENVAGMNGQQYLVLENRSGAIVVPEFDPSQTVSVWR